MDILEYLLAGTACLLAIPAWSFVIEILAALAMPSIQSAPPSRVRGSVAVLVPAHNEAVIIRDTLQPILMQLKKDDQLIVVADNCTDDTAAIARACGATVIERQDAKLRGKPYALDFGVRHIEKMHDKSTPAVVMVIDADCIPHADSIDKLALEAERRQTPIQALYLMSAPGLKSHQQQIAEFAWLVKNYVRPLGLSKLGQGCALMGSGMAFPWPLLRGAKLINANLAEDYKQGIDLALAGYPTYFFPDAKFTSEFPQSRKIAAGQRRRWEHGSLEAILKEAPLLIKTAIAKRDSRLLAMAIDLCIPPLALLSLLVAASFGAFLMTAWSGATSIPLVISAITALLFASAVFFTWRRFGRDVLPPAAVFKIPLYVVSKVPLYLGFIFKREREWVKTKRS